MRVLIGKQLTKNDQQIVELGQLEEERVEGESEDVDYVDLQKDLLEDVEKIKKSVKEHFNVCFEIGSMASFIITNNPETRMEEDKVKQDAQAALTKCEKDEVETDEKVKEWTKANKKWLKRKTGKMKQGRLSLEGGVLRGLKQGLWRSFSKILNTSSY